MMSHHQHGGYRVAAVVADGFEQVEFTEPKQALEQAGATVDVISLKPGEVQGFNHFDRADRFPVTKTIDEARAEDYDALLIPGGVHSPDQLRANDRVLEFVQAFDKTGKPMAVICHGPWVLVSSGVARGRNLTSYHTIKDDMMNAGANWENRAPIVDRNLVTARSPKDIPQFNDAMLKLFGLGEQAARRAA
ncbi:MAG TPA: type 1 glutamine amidotransferase domain-containing protein [Armatimonadota bacterium]|nr:type 1 glutamine amidotransferase domain-containing protein [Armatimonadota bacterium]